ncbi:uncharacterized protein LOC111519823 [Drosophila willistoni]|uniref:uncharacterized protein LOC111519823 n=1 Tax=Drosophila willistoni TaxID=7260 RepID=UPI000C26C377|nr:uncharacterized protein LOC111519823 [Drosophila willistoni]
MKKTKKVQKLENYLMGREVEKIITVVDMGLETKTEKDVKSETKTEVDMGLQTKSERNLKVLVKFKDQKNPEFVSTTLANEQITQMIIKFYEEHVCFLTPDSNA